MKLAILVGHHHSKQGSLNYIGESEYLFNKRIAKKVSDNFSEVVQFFISSKQVNDFEPDMVFELHFNSFFMKAYGFEIMALADDFGSVRYAERVAQDFYEEYGYVKRRGDGVYTVKEYDRGYNNLKKLDAKRKIIFEPVFANFRTNESEDFFKDEKRYVNFLCDQIEILVGSKNRAIYV